MTEENSDLTNRDQPVKQENTEAKEPLISNEINEQNCKAEYFKTLSLWVDNSNLQAKAMAYFPYYLMSTYPQLFQSPAQPSTVPPRNPTVNPRRTQDLILEPARHEEIINQNGGYEYLIAPLWKRLVAEIIDVFILFIIKLLLAFIIIDLFDINIGIELDFETLKNYLEDDYKEILSFTSDFLILEIITKIAACFYEAVWTSKMNATPGKLAMGLRILHIDAVVPLDAQQVNNHSAIRALLYPATNLNFRRALFRAIAKNMLTTLLFPMYFIIFFFRHNRTGYDIITKTIVVEDNPTPVLRRL